MKTTTTKTTTAAGQTTDDASDVRVRNQRRAERAAKIASMAKAGHPMASAALAQHQKVSALEDELNRERSMLMGILKFVK